MVDLNYYLVLSALLFTIGVIGVLTRRNAIIIFMCIELMLNAVNLSLVSFSSFLGNESGQMFVFFVMAVAAAEAAIGLAIVISLYRNKETLDIDKINILKW
ncbi:MAG: NADH-quinone oxidoreductase subunit NuoK [Ignavibacteria bacterium]